MQKFSVIEDAVYVCVDTLLLFMDACDNINKTPHFLMCVCVLTHAFIYGCM